MQSTTVTSKGQVVIPARLRKKLGLRAGTRVVITETERGLLIQPVDNELFEQYAGILPGKGRAVKELLRERREDTHRE